MMRSEAGRNPSILSTGLPCLNSIKVGRPCIRCLLARFWYLSTSIFTIFSLSPKVAPTSCTATGLHTSHRGPALELKCCWQGTASNAASGTSAQNPAAHAELRPSFDAYLQGSRHHLTGPAPDSVPVYQQRHVAVGHHVLKIFEFLRLGITGLQLQLPAS